MPRAPKKQIIKQNKLKVKKEFLRFSTPREVALYRAEKLKCKKLVEIGASIGGQTIAFSRKCKQVLAIELDKEKSKTLLNNLKKLKIKNVKVLNKDALSKKVVEEIKNFSPEIIFCDTERPAKSERILENIQPSIREILKTFLPITKKIAIEIPPLTQDIDSLKEFSFEKEFISLDKQLNRLTLYFNELKNYETSAISIPSKEKITNSNAKLKKIKQAKENLFLHTIDPTIITANLLTEICEKFNAQILELNKPVLISKDKINSEFLTSYKISTITKNNQKEILENLKKLNVKKVILRYKILPENYWKIRNEYEKELSGEKEISLFIDDKNKQAILCEKV